MSTTPKQFETALGRHLLAEFYECNSNLLNNIGLIEQYMTEAAEHCGATVVQKVFHLFNPYGVSGVVVIAESHLAIHTWPEFGYAAVDLFTCGDTCDPLKAYEYLQEKLMAGSSTFSELKRGLMDPVSNKPHKIPFEVHQQYFSHPVSTPVQKENTQAHAFVTQGAGPVNCPADEGDT